jgi:hypothetical protein
LIPRFRSEARASGKEGCTCSGTLGTGVPSKGWSSPAGSDSLSSSASTLAFWSIETSIETRLISHSILLSRLGHCCKQSIASPHLSTKILCLHLYQVSFPPFLALILLSRNGWSWSRATALDGLPFLGSSWQPWMQLANRDRGTWSTYLSDV